MGQGQITLYKDVFLQINETSSVFLLIYGERRGLHILIIETNMLYLLYYKTLLDLLLVLVIRDFIDSDHRLSRLRTTYHDASKEENRNREFVCFSNLVNKVFFFSEDVLQWI